MAKTYVYLYPYRTVKVVVPDYLTTDEQRIEFALDLWPWPEYEPRVIMDESVEDIHYSEVCDDDGVRRYAAEGCCTLTQEQAEKLQVKSEERRRKIATLQSQIRRYRKRIKELKGTIRDLKGGPEK